MSSISSESEYQKHLLELIDLHLMAFMLHFNSLELKNGFKCSVVAGKNEILHQRGR